MNAPFAIKGWCPTALRPMMSGDGLLVRVRPPDGALTADQALALADLSRRFGNGHIDLTARANLQMRGVREEGLSGLLDGLRNAGLLDREDDGQVPINIVLPPLAGFDRTALVDARDLARQIETNLRSDDAFRALPSKFGFAIDDGGVFAHGATDAIDISLIAQECGGNVEIAIGLGGEASCFALATADDAAQKTVDVARAFLTLREDERRMRALVAAIGAEDIFKRAALRYRSGARRGEASPQSLGVVDAAGQTLLGVAAPFGAWIADDVATLGKAVAGCGGSLRPTTSRTILLTGLDQAAANAALRDFAGRGLIVAADDARLAIAACVGAPACASASVSTRELATDVAARLPKSGCQIALHVSGCAKGCAHPRAAPFTLVGRDGRYDLVIDGAADSRPSHRGLDRTAALRFVVGNVAS